MERRRLLRAAAGVGVAGTVGTAAVVAGSKPSLPPARVDNDVHRPDDAPVVAADETTRDPHPAGLVRQESTVFDLDAPKQYALFARYILYPGENQYSNSWQTSGLTVEHRVGGSDSFDAGTVVSRQSEFVAVSENSSGATYLGLETDHAESKSHWQIRFDSSTGNSLTYRFLTTMKFASEPSAGDALVATEFEASYSRDWFTSETIGRTVSISYGDEDD